MDNRDETASLISAGKVQGTNVYNTNGDSLGEVYDVMIDMRSRTSNCKSGLTWSFWSSLSCKTFSRLAAIKQTTMN